MWLGPEYFARVPGAGIDAIVNAGWLQVTAMDRGILELVASAEPFADDGTADLQHRLWKPLLPTQRDPIARRAYPRVGALSPPYPFRLSAQKSRVRHVPALPRGPRAE